MAVLFDNVYKIYYIDYHFVDAFGKMHHLRHMKISDSKYKSKSYVKSIEYEVINKRKQSFAHRNYEYLDEVIEKYFIDQDTKHHKETTRKKREMYKKYIKTYFNQKPMKEMFNTDTLLTFKAYINEVPYQANLKNRIIQTLKEIILFLVFMEILSADIMQKAEFILTRFHDYSVPNNSKNKYTPFEDVKKILNVMKEPYKSIFSLLYLSGCRINEFLGIKKSDVEILDDKTVKVSINKQRNRTGNECKVLKTKASYRNIYFVDDGAEIMINYLKMMKLDKNDFVFNTYQTNLKRELDKACLLARVPHNTLHGFGRKSMNTEIYKLTKNPKACQAILGHSTVNMNLDHYVDEESNKMEGINALATLHLLNDKK